MLFKSIKLQFQGHICGLHAADRCQRFLLIFHSIHQRVICCGDGTRAEQTARWVSCQMQRYTPEMGADCMFLFF